MLTMKLVSERPGLRVFELGEELAFVHDGVDGALGDDAGLEHLFHGEELAGFLVFYFPDLAEAALADDVVELEDVLVDGWIREAAHLGSSHSPFPTESYSCPFSSN